MDGNVPSDVLFLQQMPEPTVAVASAPSQRDWLQKKLFRQTGDAFGFGFRGVGYPSGQDEPTKVHDDVLLVLQSGRLARTGGAPTLVGVHRVQRHPSLWTLEVPYFLVLHTVDDNGGLG